MYTHWPLYYVHLTSITIIPFVFRTALILHGKYSTGRWTHSSDISVKIAQSHYFVIAQVSHFLAAHSWCVPLNPKGALLNWDQVTMDSAGPWDWDSSHQVTTPFPNFFCFNSVSLCQLLPKFPVLSCLLPFYHLNQSAHFPLTFVIWKVFSFTHSWIFSLFRLCKP